MARACAYRHDVRCPDCRSNRMAKAATVSNGRQRFKCGDFRTYLSAGS